MGPDRRLRLFIYARIVISFLFLASTVVLNSQETASVRDYFHSGIVRLMLFSFLFSLASHVAFRFIRIRFFVIYLQSIWDVLFVTLLLLFTGGVTSPYSFLYLLSIMNAGMLLGRREALYAASLCGILYGAMVDFQYFGLLEPIGLAKESARELGESRLLYTIFLNVISFGVTAFITGYLSERARISEEALQARSIDYDELSQLNSKIVSNIETGLLTTNFEGKIRVFNPHAEYLTGISQEEAYNRPIISLFPQLVDTFDSICDVVRGEFAYSDKNGREMILGFSAAPLDENQRETASLIFNFRDITAIRRMEEALKRADRLAAVGELSARMAHEIRNPLAAMRGSVQMLAEQGALAGNDARLLSIVLRESDRLNILISDFLAYARPTSPSKISFEAQRLVEDLRLLLEADDRYTAIEIINAVDDTLRISADPAQIEQVMMNLFANAAEAMNNGGRIRVEGYQSRSALAKMRNRPVTVLTISDTGPGISVETQKHLFEPFWTTKTAGTGLGLAIVYRIIDSHGGNISIESPSEGGCRVVIELPV